MSLNKVDFLIEKGDYVTLEYHYINEKLIKCEIHVIHSLAHLGSEGSNG